MVRFSSVLFLAVLVFCATSVWADCALAGATSNFALAPNLDGKIYAYKFDAATQAFQPGQPITQIGAGENLSAYADFDRDGQFDVLTYRYTNDSGSSPNGKFHLWINLYRGNRNPATCLETPIRILDDFVIDGFYIRANGDYGRERVVVEQGDVNNDGFPDVIIGLQGTTSTREGKVFFSVQTAPGVFSLPDTVNPLLLNALTYIPKHFTIGDYNQDGKTDQLLVNYIPDSGVCTPFEVYFASGTGLAPGYFTTPVSGAYSFLTSNMVYYSFNAGDLNGDGKLDAVYGVDDDGDPGQLWKRFGDGAGSFSPESEVASNAGTPFDISASEGPCTLNDQTGVAEIGIRDFTNDGISDLVMCQRQTRNLYYAQGQGLGNYDVSNLALVGTGCLQNVVVGPGVNCLNEDDACSNSADCCQLSDGYFQNQWCSFDGTGRCCAFGFHYDASAADCVADLPVNTPVPYSPQDIPANLIELSCPVLAPTERTEFRLECVHDTQPCAPLVDPNPPFVSYPNVNANFIRRDGSYYYYEIYALQDGPYLINAEYPGVGKTSCTINRISTSAALTVPDLPLFLIPLLLLAAGLFIRRKNRRL